MRLFFIIYQMTDTKMWSVYTGLGTTTPESFKTWAEARESADAHEADMRNHGVPCKAFVCERHDTDPG